MKRNWHIEKAEGQVTVSRQLPARFDVRVSTYLAGGDKLRLATQIRQDMWRAVQSLRGFSPVVQVAQSDDGLLVTAGGRVMGKVTAHLEGLIAGVLEDPKNRARWLKCAGYPKNGGAS